MNAALRLAMVVATSVGVAVLGCSSNGAAVGCPDGPPVAGTACSLDNRQCAYDAPSGPCDGSEDCYCESGEWVCDPTCAYDLDSAAPYDAPLDDGVVDSSADAGSSDGLASCPAPSSVVPGQSCASFALNQSCATSVPVEGCDGATASYDVPCTCNYGTWTCNEYPIGCTTPGIPSDGGDGG